jgi:hypothetical protein
MHTHTHKIAHNRSICLHIQAEKKIIINIINMHWMEGEKNQIEYISLIFKFYLFFHEVLI